MVFLFIITVIYVNPLIRQARLKNICVDNANLYAKSLLLDSSSNNDEVIDTWGNHYCNGGNSKPQINSLQ